VSVQVAGICRCELTLMEANLSIYASKAAFILLPTTHSDHTVLSMIQNQFWRGYGQAISSYWMDPHGGGDIDGPARHCSRG
jgi:hypothetical protein